MWPCATGMMAQWNADGKSVDEHWVEMFMHFKNKEIPYSNISQLCQYAMPHHRALTQSLAHYPSQYMCSVSIIIIFLINVTLFYAIKTLHVIFIEYDIILNIYYKIL